MKRSKRRILILTYLTGIILVVMLSILTYTLYQKPKDHPQEKETPPTISEDIKFPLFVYVTQPKYEDLKHIKEVGFNGIFLNSYIYRDEKLEYGRFDEYHKNYLTEMFDNAEKLELKVVISVAYPLITPEKEDLVLDYISSIQSESSLYGYYLFDEPEYFTYRILTKEIIEKYQEKLKEIDQRHPTILVFGSNVEKNKQYYGIADIEGITTYPYYTDSEFTEKELINIESKISSFVSLHEKIIDSNTNTYMIVQQAYTNNLQSEITRPRREPTSEEYLQMIQIANKYSSKFTWMGFYAWNTMDKNVTSTIHDNPLIKGNIKKTLQEIGK